MGGPGGGGARERVSGRWLESTAGGTSAVRRKDTTSDRRQWTEARAAHGPTGDRQHLNDQGGDPLVWVRGGARARTVLLARISWDVLELNA